jgi:hypothetical protein
MYNCDDILDLNAVNTEILEFLLPANVCSRIVDFVPLKVLSKLIYVQPFHHHALSRLYYSPKLKEIQKIELFLSSNHLNLVKEMVIDFDLSEGFHQ